MRETICLIIKRINDYSETQLLKIWMINEYWFIEFSKKNTFFNLLIDTDSWVIDNDWKDNTVPVA